SDLGGQPISVDSTGAGNLHLVAEVNIAQQPILDTLNGLFAAPQNYYINIHTNVNGGGAIRAQLQNTDRMTFQMNLLPSNETPPVTGFAGSAPSAVGIHTMRNADGTVAAGAVVFDANPRFPAGSQITAMHIHDGPAGQAGPITIDSRLAMFPVLAAGSGSGNIYRITTANTPAAIKTLNDIVLNPENHYLNIHTADHGSGAARSQLAAANIARPNVTFAETAVLDPSRTALAPGSLASIFGSNLAKAAADLSGFSGLTSLPPSLNGASVTIDGVNAPVIYVSPGQLNIQVPVRIAQGPHPLVATNSNGAGAAFMVTIADAAPVIFYDTVGGLVIKNSDYSLVRPANPATAGDVLIVYVTGLGVTVPPLSTGLLVPTDTFYDTVPVTATVGGQSAGVLYSIASPGFAGLYQVAIQIPLGSAGGNQPLALSIGNAASNRVNIAIQ
ncbi:MAG: CHRD domain-containing protein, partial [Bryobacteraceae bacterium]